MVFIAVANQEFSVMVISNQQVSKVDKSYLKAVFFGGGERVAKNIALLQGNPLA